MNDDGSPRWRHLAVAGAVVVLVVVAAAAGHRVGTSSVSTSPPSPAPAPGTTPALAPVTLKPQPIDVGFAQDMNDHHDQAVQMSLLVIDRATTQPVRTLALNIATSQRRENGMLQQFLRDRGITAVDPHRTVMQWMNEPTPHDQMPGLATRDEILRLTNAEGIEIDRLFVELMLRHHEGGVHMARYAADHAESQDIRDLASRMVVAQEREINDFGQLQRGFEESADVPGSQP
jgi:uncharacterized protein (DUF305 family)